jgi:uridylate kinase
MTVTLNGIFLELSSFGTFSKAELAAAKASRVSTEISADFQAFVSNWMDGVYDEDPDAAIFEAKSFLK